MQTSPRALGILLTVAAAPLACGSDPDEAADSSTSSSDGSAATDPTGAGPTSMSTAADVTGDPTGCAVSESFDGGDAAQWPAPWTELGGIAIADVVGGRGRLVPTTSSYSLARVGIDAPCVDAEIAFSFEFTEAASQGVGGYVRQNGGHLQTTDPPGEGYVVFVESFRDPAGIGIWREVGGVEQQLEGTVAVPIEPGVVYRARMRVVQEDATTTRLQARMWPEADAEPTAWQIERTDQTPSLQGKAGGVALDAWSSRTDGAAGDLFVDDIVVGEAG
ncbi:MAG: hypothetical protein JNK45_38350 [Myxococcales bacterium]|nr:hypothetical protein [Myxococcales bacterium]